MTTPNRRWKRVLLRSGLGVFVVMAVLAVYGVVVEPRLILDKRHYEVALPGLPPAASGTELAVFSDLQVGAWWANLGMVERVVREAVEAEPDAVLILGDFLYGGTPEPRAQLQVVRELLRPLAGADIPVFAVLGNHDYEVGAADSLTDLLENLGIDVLTNTAVTLDASASASSLYLVGLGPHRPGLSRPAVALNEVPPGAARVVMMHNPLTFRDLPPDSAPLALAGHTHCGQIAFPGLPEWSYLALRYESDIVVDGWSDDSFGMPGNRLFVTCGIGFSYVPIRINAAPQLTIFELLPEA